MKRYFFIIFFIISSCFTFFSNTKELSQLDYKTLSNHKEVLDTNIISSKQINAIDLYNRANRDLPLSRVYDVDDTNRAFTLFEIFMVFIMFVSLIVSGSLAIMFYFRTKNISEKVIRYNNDGIIKDQKHYIEEVKYLQSELDKIKTEYQQQISLIQKKNDFQNHYLDQIVSLFFQATYSITDQMNNESTAKNILYDLFHDYQITKLYRDSLDLKGSMEVQQDKFAAFAYLTENGTMDDIPHLVFIAQNDCDEQNRKLAREIIGRIKERNR